MGKGGRGEGEGRGGGCLLFREERLGKKPCYSIFNFKGRSMGMDVCAFTDERFF